MTYLGVSLLLSFDCQVVLIELRVRCVDSEWMPLAERRDQSSRMQVFRGSVKVYGVHLHASGFPSVPKIGMLE